MISIVAALILALNWATAPCQAQKIALPGGGVMRGAVGPRAPISIDLIAGLSYAIEPWRLDEFGRWHTEASFIRYGVTQDDQPYYGPPSPGVASYLKLHALLSRPEFQTYYDYGAYKIREHVPLMDFGVYPRVDSERAGRRVEAALRGLSLDKIENMPKAEFSSIVAGIWDGMLRNGELRLDDGTASVELVTDGRAGGVADGFLTYRAAPSRAKGSGFEPLRQIDPKLPRLLGNSNAGTHPSICGPACVVNLASRFERQKNKHPFQALREVIGLFPAVRAKLSRVVENGMRIQTLERLTKNYLESLGINARISTAGAFRKNKPNIDISSADLLSARARPIIALIRGAVSPIADRPEGLDMSPEGRMERWYPSSGNRGHFILIVDAWKGKHGGLKARIDDPLVKGQYTADLIPVRGKHMGYRTFQIVRPLGTRFSNKKRDEEFVVLTTALIVNPAPER